MSVKTILSALFIVVAMSMIIIYYFMPFSELEFSANVGNYNFTLDGEEVKDMQFYQNMRFESKHISYKIHNCTIAKTENMRDAFDIVENLTILQFNPAADNEDLTITCDEREKFEGGMFIAGEGGPTRIIQSGMYSVITHGKILLIRASKCERPNIALHELFHALGFTHSTNPNNVMYNFTNCKQTIGDDIPDLINDLYSVPSHPDLIIENASAYMHGRYLDLNISVRNVGLGESVKSLVNVKMGDSIVREVEVDPLTVGIGQVITIRNIRVWKLSIEYIEMGIEYPHVELDKTNNKLNLVLKK